MAWKNKALNNIKAYLQQFYASFPIQYILKQWMRLPARTRALPVHIWRAIRDFIDNDMKHAAALAYYTVFSLFPMTLLFAVGISAILGPAVAQEQISKGIILFLPEETETINLFQDSLAQALQQSRSFGAIALIGLIWSALGLFSNLSSSLDRIFQAPVGRSLWQSRLQAFVMTLVLIMLIVLSFITSGMLRLADALLITNPSVWITIGTFFLPFGLNLVIFVLLFYYVPTRHVNWDAIWPAAIFGAVGLEALKSIFSWYLGNLTDFQIIYGGIATGIVLLFWAFLVACVFLISAEICAQLNLWFINQSNTPQISIFSESSLSQLPSEIPPPV